MAIAAVALAVGPTSATAQSRQSELVPVPEAKPPPPARKHAYGWQVFGADAIVGAVALAVQRTEPAIALLASGAVVHSAHGRFGAAGGSILLRGLVPIGSASLGLAVCGPEPEAEGHDCLGHFFLGFAVGSLVALGIDYFVLARE
jgi:hypothetical protein